MPVLAGWILRLCGLGPAAHRPFIVGSALPGVWDPCGLGPSRGLARAARRCSSVLFDYLKDKVLEPRWGDFVIFCLSSGVTLYMASVGSAGQAEPGAWGTICMPLSREAGSDQLGLELPWSTGCRHCIQGLPLLQHRLLQEARAG